MILRKFRSVKHLGLLAMCAFFFCGECIGQDQVESLEKQLQSAAESEQVVILNQLSQLYLSIDASKSVDYAEKALVLAKDAKVIDEQSIAHINLGNAYSVQRNYKKAIASFGIALKVSEGQNDAPAIAYCLNQIGLGYKALKEFEMAIQYCEKSLEAYKRLNDQKGVGHIWSNIGDVYFVQGQYEKAIFYYQKSLEIYGGLDDVASVITVLNIIGSSYSNWGNYSEALTYVDRAARKAKENNLMALYTNILKNRSIVSRNLSQQEETTSQYTKAQQQKESAYITAIESKNILIKEELSTFFNRIEKLDTENQNKELLLKVQQDEFNNVQMVTRHEAEQSEKKILLLKQDKEISDLELLQKESEVQRQKVLLTSLVGLIFIAVIVIYLLYVRFRLKQKEKLNNEIMKQQEIRLKTVVETQEKERKRIAGDLHDGLGQLMAGLKINLGGLSSGVASLSPDKQKIFNTSIATVDEVCTELRNISHQMMPRALSVAGLVPAIEDLLSTLLGNAQLKYDFEVQEVKKLPEHIEIGIFRVVQELLTNILKHAEAAEVSIQLFMNKDHVVLIVEDDGIGINSADGKSSGIGLTNIAARVQTLNGHYSFESGPIAGTVTNIRIPLRIAN